MNLKEILEVKRRALGQRKKNRLVKMRPPKPVKRQELWYAKQLLGLTNQCWAATERVLLPVLKRHEDDIAYTKTGDATTGAAEAVNSALNALSRIFGGLAEQAERLAEIQTRAVLGETDAQLTAAAQQAVSVNISPLLTAGPVADEVALGIAANTSLIRSIPQQFHQRVANTVLNNVRSGMRYETMIEDLQRDYDITKNRAELIARDQTSKLNASFNEARQTQLGIRKYIWSTSLDERVRHSHAEKEGQTFSWDDPPEDTGHPGHDVNCRCTAIAVFELDEL